MQPWNSASYDVVVIGTGPGGATLAAELSRNGKKVLILERGSGAAILGTMLQCIKIALIPGRSLFFTPEMLSLVRGITLGGSSVLAYATAFEPDYAIFEKQGIDLKPEVEQVMSALPIAPLSDKLVGPAAKRIMSSARGLGFSWDKLPKMVYQDKCKPNCDRCTMGCPYGAKWSARDYIDEACRHGADLLTGARVTSLMIEDGRVSSVWFTHKKATYTVSAPLVILAAGGIGTPLILRESGIDNAGTDFFFDPLVVLAGTVDDLDAGREFPMAAGFADSTDGYILTDLVWPGWIRAIFTIRAGRFDRLGGHRKMLPIMVKIQDDLGGQLTKHGWVNKRLAKNDHSRLKKGSEIARKILRHAGAYKIYTTGTAAVHPGGSAKIGEVVDANLRTQYTNLYICDCSVIPASWGRPPTLTLIALGNRLSKHILARE